MSGIRLQALLLAAVLVVLLSRPGLAHRVNVFAYVEGEAVHVECGYNRTDRVRFGGIEVQNPATGAVYLTGKTDGKGNFVFAVPESARAAKADLRILLRAGEGHQNDWTITAREYLTAAPAAASTTAPPAVEVAAPMENSSVPSGGAAMPATPKAAPAVASQAVALDQAALQAVVEAAVEKKIAPLRAMLLEEKQQGPGLPEIVGGIGYFVGLAGLAACARSRRSGRDA